MLSLPSLRKFSRKVYMWAAFPKFAGRMNDAGQAIKLPKGEP
jgi:hypothetical protein